MSREVNQHASVTDDDALSLAAPDDVFADDDGFTDDDASIDEDAAVQEVKEDISGSASSNESSVQRSTFAVVRNGEGCASLGGSEGPISDNDEEDFFYDDDDDNDESEKLLDDPVSPPPPTPRQETVGGRIQQPDPVPDTRHHDGLPVTREDNGWRDTPHDDAHHIPTVPNIRQDDEGLKTAHNDSGPEKQQRNVAPPLGTDEDNDGREGEPEEGEPCDDAGDGGATPDQPLLGKQLIEATIKKKRRLKVGGTSVPSPSPEPRGPPLTTIVVVHDDGSGGEGSEGEELEDIEHGSGGVSDSSEGDEQEEELAQLKRGPKKWCSVHLFVACVVLVLVFLSIFVVAAVSTSVIVDSGGGGPEPASPSLTEPTLSPSGSVSSPIDPVPTVTPTTVAPTTPLPTARPTEFLLDSPFETKIRGLLKESFSPYLRAYNESEPRVWRSAGHGEDALFRSRNHTATTTAQQCALDWMVHQDEYVRANLMDSEGDPDLQRRKIAERYALTVFYYMTQKNAEFCDGTVPVDPASSTWELSDKGLVFVEPSVDVCDWNRNTWQGVWCDMDLVAEISLGFIPLAGAIPDEIVVLQEMKNLVFIKSFVVRTKLGGRIPSVLSMMPRLESIDFNSQSLTGTIPAEIFGGTVPLALSRIAMAKNMLTGSLPEVSPDRLLQLEILNVSPATDVAGLTGTIPASFGNMLRLNQLILPSNHLTGTIPTEVAGLGDLDRLDLSQNELEGPIPAIRGSKLDWIDLRGNDLTGELPVSWRRASHIDVSYNRRLLNGTGTVPEAFGRSSSLKHLNLEGIDWVNTSSLESVCQHARQLEIVITCGREVKQCSCCCCNDCRKG